MYSALCIISRISLRSSKPTIQKQPIKGITMTSVQTRYDLDKFKALIDKFRALDFTDEELNLFDVGTRGHFENPTTELLSFFLDSANHHT